MQLYDWILNKLIFIAEHKHKSIQATFTVSNQTKRMTNMAQNTNTVENSRCIVCDNT